MTTKQTIRQRIIAIRDQMPRLERGRLSESITEKILDEKSYKEAKVVAAYSSFGSEFETSMFIGDALARGKSVALPRVSEDLKMIQFFVCSNLAEELTPSRLGILEPIPERCAQVNLELIEFILVPGVAFTVDGKRLGYGGGYYDRVIPWLPIGTPKVAAAFKLQLLESLPTEDHDLSVDYVVCEESL
ncbi:MAG: 5-formyltetrahydrofolate cyclo-ligase [Burkholderiales bacterium]